MSAGFDRTILVTSVVAIITSPLWLPILVVVYPFWKLYKKLKGDKEV